MCAKVYQNITYKRACESIITYFILLRNNQPMRKALAMKLYLVTKNFLGYCWLEKEKPCLAI